MADSIGGSTLPRTGIQEGWTHFDKDNNILYIYNGGNPAIASNWTVVGGSGATGLPSVVIQVGPAVAQTLGAVAAINNISVSVVNQGGPISLRACSEVLNAPAANPIVILSIAKNGVALPNSSRTIVMQVASRTTFSLEAVDLVAAVGDVYTIRAQSSIPGASHEITAGQTQFVVSSIGLAGAIAGLV